jgi:hypothetical protein
VSRLVGNILDSVPEPGPDGTIFVHDLCAGALQFLEKFARALTPLEQSAKLSLSELRESLASAPPLLESIAGQEVEKWKTEVPPGSDFAFTREVSDTRQALRIFLADETERCQEIEPCFFELSFGMSEKEGYKR